LVPWVSERNVRQKCQEDTIPDIGFVKATDMEPN
jgi:hypothetical protein